MLPVKSPMTAKVAPKDNAPVSPSQILAGQMLKYKNDKRHPIQRAIKRESGVSKPEAAIAPNAARQIKRSPVANPSSPSVILKAFVKETIVSAEKGMYQIPISITLPTRGIFTMCTPSLP